MTKKLKRLEKIVHSFKQGIPVQKEPYCYIFLIEQSYVAKTSCKMECKTPEVFMVTYQFTPVDKTTKYLLSSSRSEYLFNIGSMKDNLSFKCRRRKQNRGVKLCHLSPVSFLGLLGDHVARGSNGTAPVGLLLLSWFQNLKRAHEGLIHTHHGTSIIKLPTIVRR